MTQPLSKKEYGFTLVEMLVALFIFSLISVGSMNALTSSIQSKARIDAKLETLKSIELSRMIISADMANLVLRDNRDALGSFEPLHLSGGVDSLISFTRTGRINPNGLEPRGDLERAAYVFENGSLIRRALAHENPGQNTPIYEAVLLEGVSRADIEFVDRTGVHSKLELPIGLEGNARYLARLTLEFENGQVLVQNFELAL